MRGHSMKKIFTTAAIALLVPFSVALQVGAQEKKPQDVQKNMEEQYRKFEAKAEQESKKELKGLMEPETLKKVFKIAHETQKSDKEKIGEARAKD